MLWVHFWVMSPWLNTARFPQITEEATCWTTSGMTLEAQRSSSSRYVWHCSWLSNVLRLIKGLVNWENSVVIMAKEDITSAVRQFAKFVKIIFSHQQVGSEILQCNAYLSKYYKIADTLALQITIILTVGGSACYFFQWSMTISQPTKWQSHKSLVLFTNQLGLWWAAVFADLLLAWIKDKEKGQRVVWSTGMVIGWQN